MSNVDNIEARRTAVGLPVNDLQSDEWNKAQPVPIDRYWSGDRAPESRHAEARILWTNTAMLVRFVCNQAEPLIISEQPQTETKAMNLWDRDVCEIFIGRD